MTLEFTPTRDAGLAALDAFAPHMGRVYAEGRNLDAGPERQTTSRLSPYLKHRLILEQDVLQAVAKAGGAEACAKFVQEVFWRGYFKGWLEQRPFIWARYVAGRDAAFDALARDRELRARYETAIEGRTGIDAFDHWARELSSGGWLHNHTRMWTASIWMFTLELPWELGADWFLRHLVDGDAASNTLSWRWVGGMHTRGRTYLARPGNIRRYTDGRFDPEGLATTAEMPTDDEVGPAVSLPDRATDAPDGAGWLLLSEDLGGGFGDAPVLTLPPGTRRGPGPTGSAAAAFEAGAVEDATRRFGAARAGDWSVDAVRDWMGEVGVDRLAVHHVPQGPVCDRLAPLVADLNAAEIPLVQVIRRYDATVWPHARKGYFAVKKQIPALLAELGY